MDELLFVSGEYRCLRNDGRDYLSVQVKEQLDHRDNRTDLADLAWQYRYGIRRAVEGMFVEGIYKL